jgi:hypothetical protein
MRGRHVRLVVCDVLDQPAPVRTESLTVSRRLRERILGGDLRGTPQPVRAALPAGTRAFSGQRARQPELMTLRKSTWRRRVPI